jgi:hypothetical protein
MDGNLAEKKATSSVQSPNVVLVIYLMLYCENNCAWTD